MVSELIRITAWGVGVLIFQIGTASLLEIGGIRPDFLLIYTLIVMVRHNRYAGLVCGFVAGLLQDSLMIGFIGVQALAKSSVGFWCGVWLDNKGGKISSNGWLLLGLSASLIQGLVAGMFYSQGSSLSFGSYFVQTILPTTLYTGIIAYLWGLSPFNKDRKAQPGKSKSPLKRRIH